MSFRHAAHSQLIYAVPKSRCCLSTDSALLSPLIRRTSAAAEANAPAGAETGDIAHDEAKMHTMIDGVLKRDQEIKEDAKAGEVMP